MSNQNTHSNYERFCEELKDQGFLFEVWRMAREGEHSDRDFKDRFWDKLSHVARRYPDMGSTPALKTASSERASQVESSTSSSVSQGTTSEDEGQEFESTRATSRVTPARGKPARGGKSKRSLVLECLKGSSEALRQVEIAHRTGIEVTALYNLIDDMKKNGLVMKTKVPGGGGKEVTVIGITDRGKDELDRNQQAYL